MLKHNLIALQTIISKEILRFSRIWVQTIIPPIITVVLYFLIFGHLIGPRIGPMNGITYINFIMPGLIMLAVIQNSYANVVSSFYGSKFQKNIEEMLVSPIPNSIILIGFVGGGVARGMAVGLAITIISFMFTDINPQHIGLTICISLLTSILFALAGFINGVYAQSFDDISIIPTFVLTPLTYLGGIFYSITLLPEFWQTVSLFNPVLYMISAFRYAILGVSDIPLLTALSIIIGFIIVLFFYSLSLLNRGIGIKS